MFSYDEPYMLSVDNDEADEDTGQKGMKLSRFKCKAMKSPLPFPFKSGTPGKAKKIWKDVSNNVVGDQAGNTR